jgi:hypothetical protein
MLGGCVSGKLSQFGEILWVKINRISEQPRVGTYNSIEVNQLGRLESGRFKPFLNMYLDHLGDNIPDASYTVESIGLHGVWIDVDSDAGITYKKR